MEMAVTQRLAVTCARHPWRTVGAWSIVLILAIASNVLLMGSALTPEGGITSETDSSKGLDLVDERFPERDAVSELSSSWPTAATRKTPRSRRPWPACARRSRRRRRFARSATRTHLTPWVSSRRTGTPFSYPW